MDRLIFLNLIVTLMQNSLVISVAVILARITRIDKLRSYMSERIEVVSEKYRQIFPRPLFPMATLLRAGRPKQTVAGPAPLEQERFLTSF